VSEEILINITPQREAAIAPSMARGPRLGPISEAEHSRMHLTYIRAAERQATDGRAGDRLCLNAAPGMAAASREYFRV
jgi:hypothetical protein